MKKIFGFMAVAAALFVTACNFSATETTVNEDSLRADSIRVADSIAASKQTGDSTLNNLGDSLKADVNAAAGKLKEGAQSIKEGAEELGKVAAEKAKAGAEAVKEGAQKVGEAVKEGAQATKEALKKN